jgi:hypothetical protein
MKSRRAERGRHAKSLTLVTIVMWDEEESEVTLTEQAPEVTQNCEAPGGRLAKEKIRMTRAVLHNDPSESSELRKNYCNPN